MSVDELREALKGIAGDVQVKVSARGRLYWTLDCVQLGTESKRADGAWTEPVPILFLDGRDDS